MGHVIAISGKGGVGKTTLCGLLIQYLCESGKCPVLAVDADANANLNEVLGVEPEITLGELREEIERAGVDPRYQIPSGMTKQAYLEMRLSDAIAEEDDYDLMVMGRTQGQGCYCFVNGLVQTQVQKLQSHYPYIVVERLFDRIFPLPSSFFIIRCGNVPIHDISIFQCYVILCDLFILFDIMNLQIR